MYGGATQKLSGKQRELDELETRRGVLEERVRASADKSRKLHEAETALAALQAEHEAAKAKFDATLGTMLERYAVHPTWRSRARCCW